MSRILNKPVLLPGLSHHPPALSFVAPKTIVILPLCMWCFEWLSLPLDCKVYGKSTTVFAGYIVGVHWTNKWPATSNFNLSQENWYHCLIILARADNHNLDSNYVFYLNISKQDKNKQLEIACNKRERETKISLGLCQRS